MGEIKQRDKSLRPRRSMSRPVVIHALRIALLGCIVLLIHDQHRLYRARQAERDRQTVAVDTVLEFFPQAVRVADWNPSQPGRSVLDANGDPLGYVLQTSPPSDSVIGYSGPTNSLIAFGKDDRIVGMRVLSSGDTVEHVRDVERSRAFMDAYVGLRWDEAAQAEVDVVSGATLTSLAISEGIRKRLGGNRPSLRFPRALELAEVRRVLPEAATLAARPRFPSVVDARDSDGKRIGALVRSSPIADRMHGYQGPSDTLLVLDADDRVQALRIRDSYDNEPYVTYVRDDWYFPTLFVGKSLDELAAFDVEAAQVEGVSGATMTSVAIAATLPVAARRALQPMPTQRRAWQWQGRDTGTAVVIVCGLVMCFTSWRRWRPLRIAFQIALVGYLGFVNGDLVSQTQLVGWSRGGIPWSHAGGMVLLTAAATLVPIFTKRQLYCAHLCPFGAVQQLIRRRSGARVVLPPWSVHVLGAVPGVLIALVVATAMAHLPINLAAIEPFDAFLFWIAGWASIAIAVAGLIASWFVPMAYCRFGCPTGALLGYLRFHARSDRIHTRDLVACALLLFALGMRVL